MIQNTPLFFIQAIDYSDNTAPEPAFSRLVKPDNKEVTEAYNLYRSYLYFIKNSCTSIYMRITDCINLPAE